MSLAYGEMILRDAQQSAPNMVDSVERCEEAGHTVFLSQVAVSHKSFTFGVHFCSCMRNLDWTNSFSRSP